MKEAKKVLNEYQIAKNQNRVDAEELNTKYHELLAESKRHKIKAEGLKIAINRMYGAFRDIMIIFMTLNALIKLL